MPIRIQKSYFGLIAIISLVSAVFSVALTTQTATAACPAVETSRGTVTSTINVQSSGTYKVWSRMQASSATNDSYVLQIDDSVCGVIVGDGSVPTSGWKWVDYKQGGQKITVNLTAGTHTVKMIGREDSVKVDKLLFLSDQSCVPENFGDNCEVVQDTTPPEKPTFNAPTNNEDVVGTKNLNVTATDTVGVTKVEFFFRNGNGTNTSIGVATKGSGNTWGRNFDSTAYQNGTYQIFATAWDAAGNSTSSNLITFTINNPVPDTTPPQLSILSPPAGSNDLAGVIKLSASASDESGISRVIFKVDNSEVGRRTQPPYEVDLDTKTLSKGSHTVKVEACDNASSANCTTKQVAINVNNDQPVYTARNADFNNNGEVDLGDLTICVIKIREGQPVDPGTNGDVTANGLVELDDLTLIVILFGDTY